MKSERKETLSVRLRCLSSVGFFCGVWSIDAFTREREQRERESATLEKTRYYCVFEALT